MHLGDLALKTPCLQGKLLVAGLQQIGVEAAAMLNRAERIGGDGEPDVLLERIALQRHIAQVRQKPPPRPALGMAHIVAGEHGFAGQLAATRHSPLSFLRISNESRLRLVTIHKRGSHLAEIYGDCLLYTSDAADEEDSVDLGGRRIIKK